MRASLDDGIRVPRFHEGPKTPGCKSRLPRSQAGFAEGLVLGNFTVAGVAAMQGPSGGFGGLPVRTGERSSACRYRYRSFNCVAVQVRLSTFGCNTVFQSVEDHS